MRAGQRLYAGKEYKGSGGTILAYQGDGNLVLYKNGHPLWASDTFAPPGYVELQHDGNFVMYNEAGVPVWATGTFASDAQLLVGPEGLQIRATATIWKSTVNPASEPEPGPGPEPSGDMSALRPDGQWLRADSGRYDYRERTDFSLLAYVQNGQADHARALIREARQHKFNAGRVLATYTIGAGLIGNAGPDVPNYWSAVEELCNIAYEEGYRLRLTIFGALEPFGAVWRHSAPTYFGDVQRRGDDFAVEFAERTKKFPHVTLELANEPVVNGFNGLGAALVNVGEKIRRVHPEVLMNAGDISGMELGHMFASCFNLVDEHPERSDRLRFLYGVKRSGESVVRDQQPRPVPAIFGEPFNMGENRRDGVGGGQGPCPWPVSAYAHAAVTRVRQILPNFHYDGGLYGTFMQPITIECAQAFHRALDILPMRDEHRWRGTQGFAGDPANYWDYHMNPASDDPNEVERHIQDGRGPFRAFGCGPDSVAFPEPLGWDFRSRIRSGNVERIDYMADDAWGVGLYRRV